MNDTEKAIDIIRKYHLSKYEHDRAYENTNKYDSSILAFRAAINALQEKLEREKYPNSWIPISERLPTMEECHKNNNRFIVSDTNKTYEALFDYLADGCVNPFWCFCACQPTHWMPLPEPSKGNNNDI